MNTIIVCSVVLTFLFVTPMIFCCLCVASGADDKALIMGSEDDLFGVYDRDNGEGR